MTTPRTSARSIDRIAGWTRACASGWAWGNRIARTLAADSPQRVASLVLLAAGGKVPADPIVAETTARLREPGLTRGRADEDVGASAARPGLGSRGDSSLSRNPGRRRRRRRPPPAGPRGSKNGGPGGSAPMLVIQGLQDKVAPPGNGRDLKTNYPNRVTLVEIDGAGHGIVVEHPARIAEETVRFLAKHPLRQ